MHQRIDNRASDGFIFVLCRIRNEDIRKVFTPKNLLASKRQDSALGEMLKEPTLLKQAEKEYLAPDSQSGLPLTFEYLAHEFELTGEQI
jgi:hypothetical protein